MLGVLLVNFVSNRSRPWHLLKNPAWPLQDKTSRQVVYNCCENSNFWSTTIVVGQKRFIFIDKNAELFEELNYRMNKNHHLLVISSNTLVRLGLLCRKGVAGWIGTIPQFVDADRKVVRKALEDFIEDAGSSQVRAWRDSIPMMQTVLSSLKEISRNSGIVVEDGTLLEYRLPMEGGRRPDIIVLENGVVVVLEFKGKPNWKQADVDQAHGYKRDLENYHSVCQGGQHPVHAILVLTRNDDAPVIVDGVHVSGPEHLPQLLAQLTHTGNQSALSAEHFLQGEYVPFQLLLRRPNFTFKKHHYREFVEQVQILTLPTTERRRYHSNLTTQVDES